MLRTRRPSSRGLLQGNVRRIGELPGVDRVAVGTQIPWRDAGSFGPGFDSRRTATCGAGRRRSARRDSARSRPAFSRRSECRSSPAAISTMRIATAASRSSIVSQSLAQRMFPNQDAVNRHIMWTDPVMKFIDVSPAPRRIVGVVADVDDENVVPGPALTVYHPFGRSKSGRAACSCTRTANPYALVSPITRIIRELSADQPVERAATLEDIRAEVLTPDRLNTLVFGGFAVVALAIAVVGVAGVLAFSVSGRTREFGIRLAIGSEPRHLVTGVIAKAR